VGSLLLVLGICLQYEIADALLRCRIRYAREHLPDHARLIANVVRWATTDQIPLTVDGTGLIDCHLYQQPGRTVLHLVNLTSEASWRAPLDELIRVGPFKITMPLPPDRKTARARLLVAGSAPAVTIAGANASLEIASILDHEVVVLE
jgi:hypothetical protein